jgi:hypothetical protein
LAIVDHLENAKSIINLKFNIVFFFAQLKDRVLE